MKKFINLKAIFALAILSLLFTSCEDNDFLPEGEGETVEAPALKSGSADFSNYVAIGGSITSGYTDGALFMKGQMNSSPNLLSQKFSKIGGGTFTTPMTNDNIGGLLMGGTVIQGPRLFFNAATAKPTRISEMPTNEITMVSTGSFNNMGIPGAKSFHLLAPGYGNLAGVPTGQANPYFARFASSAGTTVMADAISQSPTFFSLWLGGNDVLSYSLAGGDGTNQAGNFDPSTYGSTDITEPMVFASVFSGIVDNLVATGSKGVLLNLPYVTSIPYFTTVPHNPVPLDETTAGMLNGGFALYNGGVGQALAYLVSVSAITQDVADAELAKRTVIYAAGQNSVLIMDESLIDLTAINPQLVSMRSATAADLIVLPSAGIIGTTVGGNPQLINGVSVPLADKWVMTPDEQMQVTTATDAFNITIKDVATAKGLAFVDTNQLMQDIAAGGLQFDEFTMKGNLVFGNTFSLDGVHPTARGNAFIANKMMMAIDAAYGSNFMESDNMLKAVDFKTNYPEMIN